jgi:hypothetical protein
MITLTEDQEKVVSDIKDFLLDTDPDNNVFTLQGIGGAGKSTVIIYAVEEFKKEKVIVGGTISHSAKFVLEQGLGQARIPCFTVAQLLNMVQYINEETGNISFVPSNSKAKSPLDNADIIIIDECSMLGPDLVGHLNSRKKISAKIIYLGDENQLAPIGDENQDSPTFAHVKGNLNAAMRYSGPIADLGLRLRSEINNFREGLACSQFVINNWQTDELGYNCRTSNINEDGSGYIFLNDIDKAIEIAVNAFKDDESPDAMRLIAFRNATIKKLNEYMRSVLFDEEDTGDLPQFMPGELVICEGGYSAIHMDKGTTRPCIYNNEVFKMKGISEVTSPNGIDAFSPELYPPVKLQEGERIFVLDHKKGQDDFDNKLAQLKIYAKRDGKQWHNYYKFRESFAFFNYTYAISCHKS